MKDFKSRDELNGMTCDQLINYEAELDLGGGLGGGKPRGTSSAIPIEYDTTTDEEDERYKARRIQALKDVRDVMRDMGC